MTRRPRQTTGDRARTAAVDELTRTCALLYFRMRKAAEELSGEVAHASGRRSILKSLIEGGPQTVPQMARERAVSRQHIQTLVNSLRADGLVELRNNPAHKRSRLVAVSVAGRAVAAAAARREARIFPRLTRHMDLDEIRTATRVLRQLKAALESEDWRRMVGAPAVTSREGKGRLTAEAPRRQS